MIYDKRDPPIDWMRAVAWSLFWLFLAAAWIGIGGLIFWVLIQ